MLNQAVKRNVKFNSQYKGLAATYFDNFHDRFLIIDNAELHGLGSSINCLGRCVTSYTTRDARRPKIYAAEITPVKSPLVGRRKNIV